MPFFVLCFLAILLSLHPAVVGAASVEGRVLQTLSLAQPPLDVAISPDGQRLFVLVEKKLLLFTIQGEPLGEYPLAGPVTKISAQGPNLVLLSRQDQPGVEYLLIDVRYQIDNAGAPFRGPEDAPVTVTLFDDFQCPYCAKLVPTVEQVLQLYPQQVKVVFRNFPLTIHPFARPAALAALAASRQGKFWEFHDQLFANFNRLNDAKLDEIATALSLDLARFKQDMADPQLVARIEADQQEGMRVGVRGTPAVFINGRALPDRSINGFRGLIEDELQQP